MSFIFLRNRVTGGAAFSPASLFASGEEGAWYEPSTTTCFTDTAGTTAATYGDAVARINDLSGNGNHATQATAAARPILARVPEGGRRNELSETDTLATQSVTVTAAERTLSFTGTGTVTLTGASTAGPLVGTGAGDRVSLTFTPSAGSLTLTVLGTVTDAQLELGATATAYQLVADADGYDITEGGVDSLDYLSFDGTDDWLITSTVDFTATDEMNFFAGVKRNANGVLYILAEFADANQDWSLDNGRFVTFTNTSNQAGFAVKGSVGSVSQGGSLGITTFVYSGLAKISTDTNIVRVDGSQVSSVTTNLGVGNFGSSLFSIGARNTTAVSPLDGHIYGLIVRGAASTAQEISDTETYLAAKSGVSL